MAETVHSVPDTEETEALVIGDVYVLHCPWCGKQCVVRETELEAAWQSGWEALRTSCSECGRPILLGPWVEVHWTAECGEEVPDA